MRAGVALRRRFFYASGAGGLWEMGNGRDRLPAPFEL